MLPVGMHANQLTVSPEMVRNLVGEQFPEWRALPIREVCSQGTVNALFRIGDRFLVAAWHLLEAGPRQAFRDDLNCDDLEWERGKAWAFQQSMGAVWYYIQSNPAMSLMGQRTLHRIMADASSP
jgi:aminoglycoside phosphotransferase (APT) family kinase protein